MNGQPKQKPAVIVFSTPTCGYCNMAKQYFRQHNVRFRDVDVSTVTAIGNAEQMSTGLLVGDRVLFPKYTGTEVQVEGSAYLVMEENEILARIKL